jgi:hypothetical protein
LPAYILVAPGTGGSGCGLGSLSVDAKSQLLGRMQQLVPTCVTVRLLTVTLVLAATACQSSTQVRASGSLSAKADPFARLDEPEPLGATPTTAGLQSVDDALVQKTGTRLALLGARHDLTLKADLAESCQCLAFGVGAPTDPRFAWEGPTPLVQYDTQLVVAFRADASCLNGKPGPSYRGYQTQGSNVILLLEAARSGRPELSGAILPRPTAGGRLLVRSSVPAVFGRSLDNPDTACVLPVSGGTRSATPAVATLKPAAAATASEADDETQSGDNEEE